MNAFAVLILVCASALRPGDCQRETALDVIIGPNATNEIMCAIHSQAFYAQTEMARTLRRGEYLKIMCSRTSIGHGNVG